MMRVKTAAGDPARKEQTMTSRVQERVEDLKDRQDRAARAAASFGVVGLLVGLCVFFVSMAPHV
jgi:hypothetical protein